MGAWMHTQLKIAVFCSLLASQLWWLPRHADAQQSAQPTQIARRDVNVTPQQMPMLREALGRLFQGRVNDDALNNRMELRLNTGLVSIEFQAAQQRASLQGLHR